MQEPCKSQAEANHRPVHIPGSVPVPASVPVPVPALDEDTDAVPRRRKVKLPI